MAWQIPLSTTGSGIAANLGATDDLFVARGVTLASTGNFAVRGTGSGHELVIDGTVASPTDGTIWLGSSSSGSSDQSVTINSGGIVRNFSTGGAIVTYGYNSIVTNHGEISATNFAVYLYGSNSSTSSSVVNTGVIHAVNTAIYAAGPESLFVKNSGSISGTTAVSGSSLNDLIINNGFMTGIITLGTGDDFYDGRLGQVDGDVRGGMGSDRLYGGAGDESLFGEDGNDILIGGTGADFLSGGAGVDRAAYAFAKTGVSVSLTSPSFNKGDAAGDTFSSIENLSGSEYNDFLYGNSGANSIAAGNGNDVVRGYAGNDSLAGGAGNDTFVFHTLLNSTTNIDNVNDFSSVDDTIQLENAIFTALTTVGALAAAAFRANGTGLAADSSDRIIYETDTGKLYYDRDGTGNSFDNVHFATLTTIPTITYADFIVS